MMNALSQKVFEYFCLIIIENIKKSHILRAVNFFFDEHTMFTFPELVDAR